MSNLEVAELDLTVFGETSERTDVSFRFLYAHEIESAIFQSNVRQRMAYVAYRDYRKL